MTSPPGDPLPRIAEVAGLPAGFAALVEESLGRSFGALERLDRAWRAGTNRFARDGEGLWAATVGDRLVGVCGLNVDPYVEDPRVARVRHLYVALSHRRRGVGRALVEAALARARTRFRRVRLRTNDPGAARFYAALGFGQAPPSDAASATHVLDVS